jgi:signal transduction histidine kinase
MVNQFTPIKSTKTVCQTVDELNKKAAALQFVDPGQACLFAKQAFALAQSTTDDNASYLLGMGESLTILSRCSIEVADYAAAIDYGRQAIVIGEAIPMARFLPQVLCLIGYAYAYTGDYVESMRSFTRLQQISLEQGDSRQEATAYMGRGLVYSFSGNQEKAIDVLQTSLYIFQRIEDQFGQTTALSNLSNAYEMLGDYDNALHFGLQALTICEVTAIGGVTARLIYANVGAAYIRLKKIAAARAYLEKALALAYAAPDPYVQLLAHLELGRLYSANTDYKQAIIHLQLALTAAVAQGQKLFECEAHEALAQVYQETGDLQKVISHLKHFYSTRDSIVNLQNRTRLGVIELEQELDTARREAAISKRLATELERQVRERTADLKASLDRETHLYHELERALLHEVELQRLKTHIINTASHEFRTPLSIISLSMEMLCDRLEQLSPEKRAHYRNRVREQILYLTDMLQDIFAINTANDSEPEYAVYRFGDFCRQLEQTLFRELQQTSGISFIYTDSDAPISTDFKMVKRILFNLLVNSIKFSPCIAPITVCCELSEQEISIRVADRGIGIPSDELTRVFDLFYRASNVETQRGLGLGLSIVQKLVHTLKGHVCAASPGVDQGSTFHVRLPIRKLSPTRVLLG